MERGTPYDILSTRNITVNYLHTVRNIVVVVSSRGVPNGPSWHGDYYGVENLPRVAPSLEFEFVYDVIAEC